MQTKRIAPNMGWPTTYTYTYISQVQSYHTWIYSTHKMEPSGPCNYSTLCLELHRLVEQLWLLVYHHTFQDLLPPQNQAQPNEKTRSGPCQKVTLQVYKHGPYEAYNYLYSTDCTIMLKATNEIQWRRWNVMLSFAPDLTIYVQMNFASVAW